MKTLVDFYNRASDWLFTSGQGRLLIFLSLFPGLGLVITFLVYQRSGQIRIEPVELLPALIFIPNLVRGYGSPLNWWADFFGTVVNVNLDRITLREQSGEHPDKIAAEIKAWTRDCIKGSWYLVNQYSFKFLRKRDAVLFKLRWG